MHLSSSEDNCSIFKTLELDQEFGDSCLFTFWEKWKFLVYDEV